jgi:hypothetical protein
MPKRQADTQTLTTWSKDELRKIAETDDLHISPFREDGATYGTPTWIWSVAVGDALYVRGYKGQNSRWYQAAIQQKAGRIIAAGMTKEVTFEPVDGTDQRPHRRRPPSEVPWRRLAQPDDRRSRPRRDSQGHAARDYCLM